MTRMTKMDYILIAEAIRHAHSHEHEKCLDTFKLIGNLSEVFGDDNPRFDSGKFFKACEVPKQYQGVQEKDYWTDDPDQEGPNLSDQYYAEIEPLYHGYQILKENFNENFLQYLEEAFAKASAKLNQQEQDRRKHKQNQLGQSS